MNFATAAPWTESGGTVRKKKPVRVPSVVRVVFVAEPETKPRPAFLIVGVVAFTSFEPAGPTSASTLEFDETLSAAFTASAVPPGPAIGARSPSDRVFPHLTSTLPAEVGAFVLAPPVPAAANASAPTSRAKMNFLMQIPPSLDPSPSETPFGVIGLPRRRARRD